MKKVGSPIISKLHDHNGKEIKLQKGKNIRVDTSAWQKIRKHCFNNNLKMGAFVQQAALERISTKIKKSGK